jgi:hypothetical protein
MSKKKNLPKQQPDPFMEPGQEPEGTVPGYTGEGQPGTGDPTLQDLAAEAVPTLEVITVTETLEAPLSSAKIVELSKELARSLAAIGRLQDQLKSVKSQLGAEIDKEQAIVNEISEKINAGHEWRPVECQLIKDYQANTITVIRLDTNEEVRKRDMTPEERQRGLDLGEEE